MRVKAPRVAKNAIVKLITKILPKLGHDAYFHSLQGDARADLISMILLKLKHQAHPDSDDARAELVSAIVPTLDNQRYFETWERSGFHVTPVHYYQPVPDTRTLDDTLWQKASELVGVEMNVGCQLQLLEQFVARYREEYESFPREKSSTPYQFHLGNDSFETVDAEMLYCMIRYFKPKRVLEIGSGYSTYVAAQAVLRNQEEMGDRCELTAIEPYPNEVLQGGFPGLAKLIRSFVQDVPLSTFAQLEENDILFIDSSHVLKIGSDVQYEFLEILPRLNKGVIVHVHDIAMPYEYPRHWVMREHRFWNEQYLLQAFLSFNDSFEILWAGSYMHFNHPEKLEAAFSSYDRKTQWPGSFWMRKIR